MRKKRAGALIIRNRKLLLVTDENAEFYWTPGGRLEEGEDYLTCLNRELEEELGIRAKSIKQYKDMKHEVVDARYFLVETEDELKPGHEVTDIHWYSKDDFENGKLKVSPRISEQVFPSLIK